MNYDLLLDKASILVRLGGDEELFTEMAGMYVAEAENYCQALADALAAGDAPCVQREAHTIKGLLATFSDDVGTEMALALEVQARAGELDVLAAEKLQARVRLLATVLQDSIAR